jgi:hypothetical protein
MPPIPSDTGFEIDPFRIDEEGVWEKPPFNKERGEPMMMARCGQGRLAQKAAVPCHAAVGIEDPHEKVIQPVVFAMDASVIESRGVRTQESGRLRILRGVEWIPILRFPRKLLTR